MDHRLGVGFLTAQVPPRPLGLGLREATSATFWLVPVALGLSFVVRFLHVAVVDPPSLSLPSWLLDTHVGLTVVFVTVFYGLAGSMGWLWAAIVSSAVFAALHAQPYSLVPLFAGASCSAGCVAAVGRSGEPSRCTSSTTCWRSCSRWDSGEVVTP
jgi:hypothetical protein